MPEGSTPKLTWARFDCDMWDNPKIRRLLDSRSGWRAVVLWQRSIMHGVAHATEGRVDYTLLKALGGTRWQATQLVEAGLWEDWPEDEAWVVHDFLRYQQTPAQVEARRESISAQQSARAHARWDRVRQEEVGRVVRHIR